MWSILQSTGAALLQEIKKYTLDVLVVIVKPHYITLLDASLMNTPFLDMMIFVRKIVEIIVANSYI